MTTEEINLRFDRFIESLIKERVHTLIVDLGEKGRPEEYVYKFVDGNTRGGQFPPPVVQELSDEYFKEMYGISDEEWDTTPQKVRIALGAPGPEAPTTQSFQPHPIQTFVRHLMLFWARKDDGTKNRPQVEGGVLTVKTNPPTLHLKLDTVTAQSETLKLFAPEGA